MKNTVRKLVAEWDEYLHIAGGSYWKLEGVSDPRLFFQNLPMIFPYGMTLLIEGLEMGFSAKSLYEEFPAIYAKKVACDTMSPTPDSFHVEFNAAFYTRLCQLIESQGLSAALYHFKGYSEREVLFTFHDAFDGPLVLSNSLPESNVRDFADKLGCTAERAEFSANMREQLITLDRRLNPSWWQRALSIFEKKKDVQ